MDPFKKIESGYTTTAQNLTFTLNTNYDPAVIDTPVRQKASFAVIQANCYLYDRAVGRL
jgi:hypothetical protein